MKTWKGVHIPAAEYAVYMQKKRQKLFIRTAAMLTAFVLVQALIVFTAMAMTGVVGNINRNSENLLYQQASKRSIYLENEMLHKWADINSAAEKAGEDMEALLEADNADIADLFTDKGLANSYLEAVSEELIDILHTNAVNSAYVILCPNAEQPDRAAFGGFKGVFFKNSYPDSSAEDHSDIIMDCGSSLISSKYNIPLDMNWTSEFSYNESTASSLDFFFRTLEAAYAYPNTNPFDCGLWSVITPPETDEYDVSDSHISYSVPLLFDGQVYGVMGITVAADRIAAVLPEEEAVRGYILGTYTDSEESGYIFVDTSVVSTDKVGKSINSGEIKINPVSGSDMLYGIKGVSVDGSKAYCAFESMELYKENTPFSGDHWAVFAVSDEKNLFGTSELLKNRLAYAIIICLAVGIAAAIAAAKLISLPIEKIAADAGKISETDTLSARESSIGEVYSISQTLSTLSEERSRYLNDLKSERERYLIALQASRNYLFEYDCINDIFVIYHFSDGDSEFNNGKHTRYRSFRAMVMNGEVCPKEDIPNMLKFLDGRAEKGIQIRTFYGTSGEVRWFSISSRAITDENGKLVRVVASSSDITSEKLAEQRRADSERRDRISGFYNSEYGQQMVEASIFETGSPYIVAIISLNGVSSFVRSYGSFCFDAVLEEIGNAIRYCFPSDCIPWKLKNSEFGLYITEKTREEVEPKLKELLLYIDNVYADRSEADAYQCHIGVSENGPGAVLKESLLNARRAVCASRIPRYDDVVFYNDTKNDIDSRAAFIYYQQNDLSEDVNELNSGYVVTESIISYALNMLEKNKDLSSCLRMIFCKTGHVLGLSRIVKFDINSDFMTVKTVEQWSNFGVPDFVHYSSNFSKQDMSELHNLFSSSECIEADKNFYCSSDDVSALAAKCRGRGCTYIFPIYEKVSLIGMIAFSTDAASFSASSRNILKELVKIISAYILKSRTSLESRAKSDFLSRMSHEIRTPMNAIMGMTSIALGGNDLDPSTEDCLKKIDLSAKYLLSLINDILDMSRIESGKMTTENVTFNIDDIVSQLDTLIRVQTEAKGIAFTINCRIDRPFVVGDPLKLNQVLVNILGNAVKFTEQGGITLTIEENTTKIPDIVSVSFSVKDTGIGISKENLGRIFNSFEQADPTTVRKYGGTGLGLTISSNLVRMLGGTLEVQSELGKGSEFSFTLPYHTASEESYKVQQEDKPAEVDFTSKRVLLVEDDELNVEIAKTLLEKDGLTIETAANGQEAVDKFHASKPKYYDAILMDIRMPVMDGLTATKLIRRSEKSDAQTVPIIAMTANAFDEDMKKSVECGMNGHLSKPIDMKKVRDLLRRTWQ